MCCGECGRHFEQHKRLRRVPIVHSQFTCKCILPLFAYDCCILGAYQILVNLTSGASHSLGGICECGMMWRVWCVVESVV